MRPLRILHIIDSLDPRNGGTVESVKQVGSALARAGHGVEVAACADVAGDPWLAGFPLTVHPLGPAMGAYAYSPALRPWLLAHGSRFDAWVVNGLWQYQGLGASRAARRLGVPYFVYPHGMLDPWNRRAHPFRYLKKALYWLLAERSTLAHARCLLFTSEAEAAGARRYLPAPGWRALVVGNGIAPPPAVSAQEVDAFRARHGVAPGERVLLYLGRVHPKKGLDLLLEAFASLDPASRHVVVIVGEGEPAYVERLKRLAQSRGIAARVRWTGPLYGQPKWAAFAAAELFVLPSHQENFAVAVVEALAAGTPVCTTTAVDIHETIARYQAGIICADDPAALASALVRWQTLTPAEIGAHRPRARQCFAERFEAGAAAARLSAAIEGAIVP